MNTLMKNIREKSPLIHCITNYVTAHDCANILLAAGARPIMADAVEEAAEIAAAADGLYINIGTLNRETIKAMIAAGKAANENRHPVILDPVGAGMSRFRTETILTLLSEIRFDVIRGNISEMRAIDGENVKMKGVDANDADKITEENLSETVAFAKVFAQNHNTVAVISGETDIVADAQKACFIRNGDPMMARITGAGCQLSALIAAFVAANPNDVFDAAANAVIMMGICGEIAKENLALTEGNASYSERLIDAVDRMTAEIFEERKKYEMR